MESSVIFVFGEMTHLDIKSAFIVCSNGELMKDGFFPGDCYPKEDLLSSSPGSSWSLGPGEGLTGTRKQPGKEDSFWLGVIDAH